MKNELLQCAENYLNLIDTQYKIVVGRKGQKKTILLEFSADEFIHISGLHKIKDNTVIRTAAREKVFRDILSEKIGFDKIRKSPAFHTIEERLHYAAHLEEILDNNRLVFGYNKKQAAFSKITADYLMDSFYDDRNIYIFIAGRKDGNAYYCRSFFPKGDKDYTVGQVKYSLLYKEKIQKSTGRSVIQYNRLREKESED